jgi:imidazolonepropionase-like amidohydrolase
MMTGTDGGQLAGPGMMLQEEFAELARAGISPLQVLQMATTNPAVFLRRTDKMGQVAKGYDANLVVLDADPLENVANLGRISGVVRAGFYYSALDLDALRQRVARGRGSLK